LDKLCTRTIEIDGGIVRDYPGGFSYYQANREKGTILTIGMSPRPAAGKPAKAAMR